MATKVFSELASSARFAAALEKRIRSVYSDSELIALAGKIKGALDALEELKDRLAAGGHLDDFEVCGEVELDETITRPHAGSNSRAAVEWLLAHLEISDPDTDVDRKHVPSARRLRLIQTNRQN